MHYLRLLGIPLPTACSDCHKQQSFFGPWPQLEERRNQLAEQRACIYRQVSELEGNEANPDGVGDLKLQLQVRWPALVLWGSPYRR